MNNKELKQLFKDACLGKTNLKVALQQNYPCLLNNDCKSCNNCKAKSSILLKFIVKDVCRHCDNTIEDSSFDIWTTYWKSHWAPCHKECRAIGMAEEAISCQELDAACNDCRFFNREAVEKQPGATLFHGECLKFNKTVITSSNFYEGRACFEHR